MIKAYQDVLLSCSSTILKTQTLSQPSEVEKGTFQNQIAANAKTVEYESYENSKLPYKSLGASGHPVPWMKHFRHKYLHSLVGKGDMLNCWPNLFQLFFSSFRYLNQGPTGRSFWMGYWRKTLGLGWVSDPQNQPLDKRLVVLRVWQIRNGKYQTSLRRLKVGQWWWEAFLGSIRAGNLPTITATATLLYLVLYIPNTKY